MTRSVQEIMKVLEGVMDPEVPVLSVVELGIIRSAEIKDTQVIISITPTYSGCPAMQVIEENIRAELALHGYNDVVLNTVYSPAWSTDWMSAEAKLKLKKYGIAPPDRQAQDTLVLFPRKKLAVQCPFCESSATDLTSQFGSTACKALYFCTACQQPFEYFKPL